MTSQSIGRSYITTFNDRLDKICFLRYGSDDNDVVIYVIESNPGIEEYDLLLPSGIEIDLPDAPYTVSVPVKTIRLW